ncbi:hypothetical protein MSG28_003008 [Choristoneura fumiferana]|uniref:Uncharacterized protein n=1 Tax=Choristoneura fumiferana TaxID=7141 RepID=A0ACC0JK64_CHOFU|nr:hypothetical protein MSG28_003008 [Choristoneura fumiferana]
MGPVYNQLERGDVEARIRQSNEILRVASDFHNDFLKPWYEGENLQKSKYRVVKFLLGQLADKFEVERSSITNLYIPSEDDNSTEQEIDPSSRQRMKATKGKIQKTGSSVFCVNHQQTLRSQAAAKPLYPGLGSGQVTEEQGVREESPGDSSLTIPTGHCLATHNIRTLRTDEKIIELEEELSSLRWDIMGLSESDERGRIR